MNRELNPEQPTNALDRRPNHSDWRPKRLGYNGRQWSHRSLTDLEIDQYIVFYEEQQPFEPTVIDLGRDGKTPPEYLTNDGLKLLKFLALGDRDEKVLARYATDGDFDLRLALDELREYELLDERDPETVGLLKKRL
ncbi:MAG: hypothetical protein KDJ97_13385 [Anaerolineae bacterium]|nr:hypothetical protein [Anaerolineae bacterium]